MQISVQTNFSRRSATAIGLFVFGTLAGGLLSGCGSHTDVDVNAISDETPSPPKKADTPPTQIDVPFNQVNAPLADEAKELTAKGGTFPAPLYKAWFAKYEEKIGVKISYGGVGSSEAIKRLINREVDFAASDAPLSSDEQVAARTKGAALLASGKRVTMGGDILHIPTAFGAIAIAYNVPNVTSKLNFSAKTLGDIYDGKIKQWNDPELVHDNPQLGDIKREIIVIHRSDGSGTTYCFTDYLARVSPAWARRSGKGQSVYWNQGIGAAKNEGVAQTLHDNPYSIGYLELGYAQRNNLTYGRVQNSAGRFIEPTLESISATATEIAHNVPADLHFSCVNPPGAASYPLVTATWLLVYTLIPDRSKAAAITRLLQWATTDAQVANSALNYAPLPLELRTKSERVISQITSKR